VRGNHPTWGSKKLILILDQARESVAAAKAGAIVVVSEINISAVCSNAGAGPIIKALAASDFANHSLRIASPIFENDTLHLQPPLEHVIFRISFNELNAGLRTRFYESRG